MKQMKTLCTLLLCLPLLLWMPPESAAQDEPPEVLRLFDVWHVVNQGEHWTQWADSLGNTALSRSQLDTLMGAVFADVNGELWTRAANRSPWHNMPDSVAEAYHLLAYADSSLRTPLNVLYTLLRADSTMPNPWLDDRREPE